MTIPGNQDEINDFVGAVLDEHKERLNAQFDRLKDHDSQLAAVAALAQRHDGQLTSLHDAYGGHTDAIRALNRRVRSFEGISGIKTPAWPFVAGAIVAAVTFVIAFIQTDRGLPWPLGLGLAIGGLVMGVLGYVSARADVKSPSTSSADNRRAERRPKSRWLQRLIPHRSKNNGQPHSGEAPTEPTPTTVGVPPGS